MKVSEPMKELISTKNVPSPVGPYSQAVKSGGFVFCSGQIPLAPDGNSAGGDIKEQARQILENIKAVLAEEKLSMDSIVKTTIYLVDLNDFAAVNETYAEYFSEPYPARATVGVAALPKGAKIEIEAIAAAE